MLISLRWLDEFLTGSADAPLDPHEVELALTSLGLEVEGVTHHGDGAADIIVGEIQSVEKHPEADRLNVVQLHDGSGTVQVVCGASNLPPAGGKVAFAPVGSCLPGDFRIGSRKLRGVESSGMICSETELEIGNDGEGIIILPTEWPTGSRLESHVPSRDTVYEIGVTPNRPDALGHLGVARDLAVKLGRTLRLPEVAEIPSYGAADLVTLHAANRCGRYYGITLQDLKVGPSPLAVRVRLHRVGLRAINNAVDVTNLVLMEIGQPLHVFDRDRLAEERVVVRMASEGETMKTLDGAEIELSADDLVIADAARPQALAGVMGGLDSGVTAPTTRGLLEAAWFEPRGIRASARRHGFHTDSSHRFERGVDHGHQLELAARRALHLLATLCGAKALATSCVEGNRPTTPEITFRPARIRGLLGMNVPADEAARILEGLDVRVDRSRADRWSCVPPTCRPDLVIEEDLLEEIMRHHGLDHLAAVPSPASEEPLPLPADREATDAEAIAQAVMGDGFHEHISMAFTAVEKLHDIDGMVPLERVVQVANPMREQQAIMRTHLLPGLLDAASLNLARHDRQVRLFEHGRVYGWFQRVREPHGPTAGVDRVLPVEHRRVAALLADPRGQADPRDLVRTFLTALERVGHRPRVIPPAEPEARPRHLHPGVQARLAVELPDGPVVVGEVGELHPTLAERWEISSDAKVVVGEIRIEDLPAPPERLLASLPRFPATSRDVSLEMPASVPATTVLDALVAAAAMVQAEQDGTEDPARLAVGDEHRAPVVLLEDYRGKGIDDGRKALLMRLSYRAADRSVTDDEVQALHDRVVERAMGDLSARVGGDLRRR